jgi:hypothetical protein
LTNADNQQNYVFNFNDGDPNQQKSILAIAYQKMPNASVYAQNSDGSNTGAYFNIPATSTLSSNQKYLVNPVALANLATNDLKSFRITPTFRLQYDLMDPEKQMLRFSSYVSFDINDNKTNMFLPQEASNLAWNNTAVNRADNYDTEDFTIYSDENLAWQPKFENTDNSLLVYGSFQINKCLFTAFRTSHRCFRLRLSFGGIHQ